MLGVIGLILRKMGSCLRILDQCETSLPGKMLVNRAMCEYQESMIGKKQQEIHFLH